MRIHGTLIAATANPHAATRRVEDADRKLDGHNVCPPCSMGFRLAAAVACARAGHRDQARRRLQAAERIAGMWPGGAWHAAIWEGHGVLRQAEGDTARAAALYSEAAGQFAELGAHSTETGAAPQPSKRQPPAARPTHPSLSCNPNATRA